MSKNSKPPKQIIGDSLSLTINFKWLLQIVAGTAIVVFAFFKLEGRIQELERNMVLALDEIELHEQERIRAQQAHVNQMEEEVSLLKKELNINPFSWNFKKKKN